MGRRRRRTKETRVAPALQDKYNRGRAGNGKGREEDYKRGHQARSIQTVG